MKFLDHLEEWLIATLIAAATLIIFASVVHRYAAGLAIPGLQDWLLSLDFSWAQELCIFMFIWMAKFGAAYGVRTGIHVGVDVLINRLPDATRGKFVMFGLLAGAVFTAIVGSFGVGLVVHVHNNGSTTEVLEWPSWIVYLAIPLGSYLMCFRFLQVAWVFQRSGELPHHDHGHVEGVGDPEDPEDINWFALDDDLHARDVKSDDHHGSSPR
ncbi:TRAP transporter small permease [Plasticicumulans acidivorans]|uniref:TRAP transporter small permease protein n=1 Tax=Plasticicumulans acidivorans TaxID=886464 RepID=A0A317MUS0_9GAMM|nr:TRAP transporter small permease [Plasticicumulans acidivorans]PWV61667.1 C4-dicarboxylate transporter DctQ subunit [Plasticicumulans acidivorans]